MPDIKLRDGSGVEQTYTGVDYITVPLADGTGTYTYGMTDEDLTFTGEYDDTSTEYHQCYPINNYITSRPELLERVKIKPYNIKNDIPYYSLKYFVSANDTTNINKITLDFIDNSYINLKQMFLSRTIKSLPLITGNNLKYSLDLINRDLSAQSSNCSILTTEQEYLDFLSHCSSIKTSATNTYLYACPIDEFDTTNINKRVQELLSTVPNLRISGYYIQDYFDYTHIRNIPIPYYCTGSYVVGSFYTSQAGYFSDSFTFYNNGSGEPYKVRMSGTIDWTYSWNRSLGYRVISYNDYYNIFRTEYYNGKVHPYTTNIFTSDSMTIEQAQARYNELKAEDKWYSCASNQVTYDGKTRYIAELFSRYNHDSAVETINSLPNVKDYGCTCTLELMKYSGALTDGGGVNTLTEEEIAVATAKGWTITLS